MKHSPILILTLSAALLLPTLSRAEDPKPGGKKRGPGGSPEERMKMMTEKLGLTGEQQGKVKEILAKNAPQLRELMAKGRENLSEEEKTKARELLKTQAEEIGTVLTPEQKEKWKEARAAASGPGGRGGKPGDSK